MTDLHQSRNMLKDRIVEDISIAIKRVQQFYINSSGEGNHSSAIRTDDKICWKLLEELDHALLHGLKRVTKGYWVLVKQFTHKHVLEEINNLQHIITDLGRGRAWLYKALNDRLFESYVNCIIKHKKLVAKHYAKDALVHDYEQLQLLQTLCSGLDEVVFELDLDQPYLDLSAHPIVSSTKSDEEGDGDSIGSFVSQSSRITSQQVEDTVSTENSLESQHAEQGAASSSQNSENCASAIQHNTCNSNNTSQAANCDNISVTSSSSTPSYGTQHSCRFSYNLESVAGELLDEEISVTHLAKVKRLRKKSKRKTSVDKERVEMTEVEKNEVCAETQVMCVVPGDEKDCINSNGVVDGVVETSAEREYQTGLAVSAEKDQVDQCHTKVEASIEKDQCHTTSKALDTVVETSTEKEDPMDQDCPADEQEDDFMDNPFVLSPSLPKVDAHRSKDKALAEHHDNYKEDAHKSTEACAAGTSSSAKASLPRTPSPPQSPTSEFVCVSFKPDSGFSSSFTDTEVSSNIPDTDTSSQISNTRHSSEITVDNNELLLLMLQIFTQDGEKLLKMYKTRLIDESGECKTVTLLVTSVGFYLLKKRGSKTRPWKSLAHVKLKDIDYISVGVESQMLNIVLINRRIQHWLMIGDALLTEDILASLHRAVEECDMELAKLCVLTDATVQKLMLDKWLRNEINQRSSEIACYSVVSSVIINSLSLLRHQCLLTPENGFLEYRSYSSFFQECWKTAYFVLKNFNLYEYPSDMGAMKATNIMKLSSSNCSGCRIVSHPGKQHCFEILFPQQPSMLLSAKSIDEARAWVQAICVCVQAGDQKNEDHLEPISTAVLTADHMLLCYEDMYTNFYRTLSKQKVEDITHVTTRDQCKYFLLNFASKYDIWVLFFTTSLEKRRFLSSLHKVWSTLFDVQIPENDSLPEECWTLCNSTQKKLRL